MHIGPAENAGDAQASRLLPGLPGRARGLCHRGLSCSLRRSAREGNPVGVNAYPPDAPGRTGPKAVLS
ncbi:putative protein without homology [Propionibacterium freudenreichii subsp. shermanii]|nr:putative protein without homology [Propionibacterium freudenreichii subsp. shermanii]